MNKTIITLKDFELSPIENITETAVIPDNLCFVHYSSSRQ